MRTNAKSKIANIAPGAPVHRVKDGYKVVVEKVPAAPDTRKYVDPQGNVRRVVLGSRVGEGQIDNPYRALVMHEKAQAGWVLYAECPIGRSVDIKGETRCKGNDPSNPGVFWKKISDCRYQEDECCEHIEALIQERRAEHNARQAEYASQFTGSQDKLVALMEAQMEREAAMSVAESKQTEVFGKKKVKDTEVRDELVRDICDQQRANGQIPRVVDNSRYIQRTLESLDRREQEPKTARPTTQKKPGSFDAEVKKRCDRNGIEYKPGYSVSRSAAPLSAGGGVWTEKQMTARQRALMQRFRLLRSKPEWYERCKRINPFAIQGALGHEKRLEALKMVMELVNKSNAVFGDWDRPGPEGPIYFHK